VTSVHGIAGLKLALDLVGFAGGSTRPPLTAAPDRARGEIERALAALQ